MAGDLDVIYRRCCLAVLLAGTFAAGAPADPFVGTWKLNVSKSKYHSGPAPKAQTVIVEPGDKIAIETTNADGAVVKAVFSVTPGEELTIPALGGITLTRTRMRVDDHTVEYVWKKGTETLKSRAVVSKNGKVMKYTTTGIDADGRQVDNSELIFDRQ